MRDASDASEAIELWPGMNDRPVPAPDRGPGHVRPGPTRTPYLVQQDRAGGDARRPLVLVLPGGGYQHLANHEAGPTARRFNELGFHAAVLHYRVAPSGSTHPEMLHDAQRAVRLIRSQASDWGVDADAIAVLGFSAGGHLAATLATFGDRESNPADDLAQRFSARVQAAVLCYAVIDLSGRPSHRGSRDNLLGPRADDEDLARSLSAHLNVDPDTPPSFLWHTTEDEPVPVENALLYASACRRHGVPFELHLYEKGRHGLGLARAAANHPVGSWSELAAAFLNRHLRPDAANPEEEAAACA